MAKQASLASKIEDWAKAGLISPEQAEMLKRRDTELAAESLARRVRADEVFVYLGSLVILISIAFLVVLNWRALESAGRILSVLVTTLLLLGLGWRLRGSVSIRLRRGAQALWMAGCLLSGLCFVVILDEAFTIDWQELGPADPLFLVSCLLATGVAGVAFVLLPSVTQSITFHLGGSLTLISCLAWLDHVLPPFDHFLENLGVLAAYLVAGGVWLGLAEWLRARDQEGLMTVSSLFGALTIAGSSFILATDEYPALWQRITMEAIAFVASIAFIAASVKRQSQVFVYSGAAFLLLLITYINFEHLQDEIGMPIALLISGVVLIGVGLGTERLRKRFGKRSSSLGDLK